MIHHARILVASSDPTARAICVSLASQRYACEVVATESAVIPRLSRQMCELVVWEKLAVDDFALLDDLKRLHPALPVIVLSADPSAVEAVVAIKHGAFEYLHRGCLPELLHRHIRDALANPTGPRPTAPVSTRGWDEDIVHESDEMQLLLESATMVAMSSAPLLLLGESGSGKERVARAIHARSPRSGRPFVAVNATALPEHLLESELFGHVRGAFTGALQTRPGLFAEANGGTLLLDEVGDLPSTIQPKLLRILQFGECRAVGSDRVRQVDVRIIAATHRDLGTLSAAGLFREDLRYRLSTLSLVVPPLRGHRADIEPLALKFLAAARARAPASPVHSIGEEAMAVLVNAPWPGNVRELESAIERIVVMGRQAVVQPADLVFLTEQRHASSPPPAYAPELDTPVTLREMTERYLAWVLERTQGDKARAAKILGIDVSTLYRWQRAKSNPAS